MSPHLVNASKLEDHFLRNFQESAHYIFGAWGSQDGIWDWDLSQNEIYFSSRWKKILGYEMGEIGSNPSEWFNRIHPDDVGRVKQALDLHLSGVEPHLKVEHRMLHKNDITCWVLTRGTALFDETGKAVRVAGTLSNLTDRKNLEDHLVHNAFYDSLTDLPNRALFLDRLKQSLLRRQEKDRDEIALLFLDIDHFKEINDRYGHQAGDELLKETAFRLKQTCRAEDTICRYGGDEFVILMNRFHSVEEVELLASRIIQALKLPFKLLQNEVTITMSIGIAFTHPDHDLPEDILQDSDFALYQAKASGRNQYKIFDESMRTTILTQDRLRCSLTTALERHQIKVYYQPIINLKTGKIAGFEALMRWIHPTYGVILPSTFIPIAEAHDLMGWLGEFVLQEACQVLKNWHHQREEEEKWFVAINISKNQLHSPHFMTNLKKNLKKFDLDPHFLRFEFTESALIENTSEIHTLINELVDLGIGIDLDNFGQGSTSLKLLMSYPFKSLKIDHTFVVVHEQNLEKTTMVLKGIRDLAKTLLLQTVMSGIETPQMLAQARALEFSYGQGFYFTKPLPSLEIHEWLSQSHTW